MEYKRCLLHPVNNFPKAWKEVRVKMPPGPFANLDNEEMV